MFRRWEQYSLSNIKHSSAPILNSLKPERLLNDSITRWFEHMCEFELRNHVHATTRQSMLATTEQCQTIIAVLWASFWMKNLHGRFWLYSGGREHPPAPSHKPVKSLKIHKFPYSRIRNCQTSPILICAPLCFLFVSRSRRFASNSLPIHFLEYFRIKAIPNWGFGQ